jgi:hypothetical protein
MRWSEVRRSSFVRRRVDGVDLHLHPPPLMATCCLAPQRRALAAKRVVGGGDAVARARAIRRVLGC